jgi:hypothetical protein
MNMARKIPEWIGETDDQRAPPRVRDRIRDFATHLKRVLHYDPVTGKFTRIRKTGPNVMVGAEAGSEKNGYRYIRLLGVKYASHRLAWFYTYGAWPAGQLDHINGNTLDNRIENLRPVTHAQNMLNKKLYRNNTSGRKGVSFHKATGKFQARIYRDKSCVNLGLYERVEDAAEAYRRAAKQLHGEFARAEGDL